MIRTSDQFHETDGKIDKSFKLVEAMCSRMALRLCLQQSTNPINLVSIQQLLKELADIPQNERFQDDEVEQAQKAYELHGKRLQQALSALENAITKKDAKLLYQVKCSNCPKFISCQVLEDYEEILPPDRYKSGKCTLDKIIEVEMKLVALLSKNDLEGLEKLLEENQDALDGEQPGMHEMPH